MLTTDAIEAISALKSRLNERAKIVVKICERELLVTLDEGNAWIDVVLPSIEEEKSNNLDRGRLLESVGLREEIDDDGDTFIYIPSHVAGDVNIGKTLGLVEDKNLIVNNQLQVSLFNTESKIVIRYWGRPTRETQGWVYKKYATKQCASGNSSKIVRLFSKLHPVAKLRTFAVFGIHELYNVASGVVVGYRDGNSMNDEIDNLFYISRSDVASKATNSRRKGVQDNANNTQMAASGNF